jgi:hypothetical protein
MSHLRAERFDFAMPRETAIYTCRRVADGAPVLEVFHDDDGEWQFLCGGDHDSDDDSAVVACLECTVARDPSLNELADLCPHEMARRDDVGSAWSRQDESVSAIQQAIDAVGWAVQYVEPGDTDDEPAFSYTIGLFTSYGHAELIIVGMRPEIMHGVLNLVAARVRDGHTVPVDTPLDWLGGPYPIRFRQVRERASYEAYVGRAIDFHRGQSFALLQLVWPDKEHRYPGEPGTSDSFNRAQPLLP